MTRQARSLASAATAATSRPVVKRDEVSASADQEPQTREARKVRVTVDFEPLDRSRLHMWCAKAAGVLGVPAGRAGAGDVIRALVTLLHEDEDLQRRVIATMRASRS